MQEKLLSWFLINVHFFILLEHFQAEIFLSFIFIFLSLIKSRLFRITTTPLYDFISLCIRILWLFDLFKLSFLMFKKVWRLLYIRNPLLFIFFFDIRQWLKFYSEILIRSTWSQSINNLLLLKIAWAISLYFIMKCYLLLWICKPRKLWFCLVKLLSVTAMSWWDRKGTQILFMSLLLLLRGPFEESLPSTKRLLVKQCWCWFSPCWVTFLDPIKVIGTRAQIGEDLLKLGDDKIIVWLLSEAKSLYVSVYWFQANYIIFELLNRLTIFK